MFTITKQDPNVSCYSILNTLRARRDSNPRLSEPESDTLSTELHALSNIILAQIQLISMQFSLGYIVDLIQELIQTSLVLFLNIKHELKIFLYLIV